MPLYGNFKDHRRCYF